MANIIHYRTVLQTEFVIIDDDGNRIDSKVATQEIRILTADEFTKAFAQIIEAKERLQNADSD